jgi:hypothetical protein
LTTFESDSNGTARASGLAFATAAGSLTVTAGFTLAKAFAAMLGSGIWF